MADEKVQLKQEEVVGDEVVLRDINPKTTTNSVEDSQTGFSLQQTIDRIWNAINSRLFRIVNSVNGRTGVVVLNANDVGLGNVDNVSFADIKEWVINRIEDEFGSSRIALFDTLHEVDDIIDSNDMSYLNTPYYAKEGYNGDKLSYIGGIYLMPETNRLTHENKSINVVGYTDDSIIYNETVGDRDLENGGIGVNISSYEDVLYLHNSDNKDEAGLRLDKAKLAGNVHFFEGVYGSTGDVDDEDALLYSATEGEHIMNADIAYIYIDDVYISSPTYLKYDQLRQGDMVVCHFFDYMRKYRTGSSKPPSNVTWIGDLMGRNSGIGMVSLASPELDHPAEGYRRTFFIKFYTLKNTTGYGLKTIPNHKTGAIDSELSISTASGRYEYFTKYDPEATTDNKWKYDRSPYNISGIQAYKDKFDQNEEDFDEESTVAAYRTMSTPIGERENIAISGGGISIQTDASICVAPFDMFGAYKGENVTVDGVEIHVPPKVTYITEDGSISPYGSRMIRNWALQTEYDYSKENQTTGAMTDASLLSVNCEKFSMFYGTSYDDNHGAYWQSANTSGLSINKETSVGDTNPANYGMTFGVSEYGIDDNTYDFFDTKRDTFWPGYNYIINGYYNINDDQFYRHYSDGVYSCPVINELGQATSLSKLPLGKAIPNLVFRDLRKSDTSADALFVCRKAEYEGISFSFEGISTTPVDINDRTPVAVITGYYNPNDGKWYNGITNTNGVTNYIQETEFNPSYYAGIETVPGYSPYVIFRDRREDDDSLEALYYLYRTDPLDLTYEFRLANVSFNYFSKHNVLSGANDIMSGGLRVNVGDFLEIGIREFESKSNSQESLYPNSKDDFYDSGKVNVRIGKGLCPEPVEFDPSGNQISGNRIQLDLVDKSGLLFEKDEFKPYFWMNPSNAGLCVHTMRLNIECGDDTYVYNPLGGWFYKEDGDNKQTEYGEYGDGNCETANLTFDPDVFKITVDKKNHGEGISNISISLNDAIKAKLDSIN